MNRVVASCIFTLVVCFFAGWFNIVGLAFVYGGIQGVLWLIRRTRAGDNPVLRCWDVLHFLRDFLWDMTVSNVILAWDVVTPKDLHAVRIVEVPVHDLTESEIALLMHRITLTPGTLSAAVIADHSTIVVHAMYGDTEEMPQALRRPLDILKGHMRREDAQ